MPKVPKKWIRSKVDELAIKDGCWFDQKAADHVCDFFETYLHHTKGKWAGQPFTLEAWQSDFLSPLYGWKRADGTRRYREAYLEVSKKNGKSTLLAGLGVYGTFEEPASEVYCGAVDRAQAGIIYDEAVRMVESSKFLSRYLRPQKSKKTIFLDRTNSKFVAMSADAPSKDGVSSVLTILDEVHRFKSDDIYSIMQYAGSARQQPLLVSITTAGHDRHSLCWALHEKAILTNSDEGTDTTFLGVIYTAGNQGEFDIDDPKVWAKANPSMGSILKVEDFRKSLEAAKESPAKLNDFLRLRLGVWTEQETRWLPLEKWDKLREDFDPNDLIGCPCFGALDLSSNTDLTCTTLLFRTDEGYKVVSYFYVPANSAEPRRKRDKVPYPQWINEGHIIATTGADALVTDYDYLRRHINDLNDLYQFESFGVDPWNGQQFCNQLKDDGIEVVEYHQNPANLSPPSKQLERLILAGGIAHQGNPCMRWNVANTTARYDSNENIITTKQNTKMRVDGVRSLIMAIGLAENHVESFAQIL